MSSKIIDMERHIAVIDMKAFYAFVECVERGLNPFTTPLAVCDPTRGEGTVVMSVSPFLKEMGVPSVCRRRELPNVPGMVLAQPRMSLYIKKSAEIINIALNYVGEDDIHVYSIDEFFVNVGPYLKAANCTAYQFVRKLQKEITSKTGLLTTAGLSYNMFMAKVALDLDGKKKPPYIAQWTKADVKKKLWKVTPLSKIWGISHGYEARLNAMGIETVGQLANADKNFLKAKLGIMGEQLWEHANGIDNTDLREKYIPMDTSFSNGQVLMRDYSPEEAKLILKEMNDDLAMRLRAHGKMTRRLGVAVRYTFSEGGGFSHQVTLDYPTDDTDKIYEDLLKIYEKYVGNHKIRGVYITYSQLESGEYDQLNLFEVGHTDETKRDMTKTIDGLKRKYGKDTILRASALLEESTAKERHNQIGGHHK